MGRGGAAQAGGGGAVQVLHSGERAGREGGLACVPAQHVHPKFLHGDAC